MLAQEEVSFLLYVSNVSYFSNVEMKIYCFTYSLQNTPMVPLNKKRGKQTEMT